MRSTNGQAFGTTVIGGNLQSTNSSVTNRISGKLLIGDTNISLLGTETLILNSVKTNPAVHVQETKSTLNVTHTAANASSLHSGFTSVALVGAGNTADWTINGYPQLMSYNSTVQPETGSSGIIRRTANYAGTIGGTLPAGSGAIIDEGVVFWGDTANASGNNLSNIVGFKMSGLASGWNNCGVWLGISQNTYPPTGNWAIWDETDYPSHFSGNIWGIGGTNGLTGRLAIGPVVGATGSTNRVDIVAGSLTTNSKALNLTATLAASASAETGAQLAITGAGSGANANGAFTAQLAAGYTGSGSTFAGQFVNQSAGTGPFGFDIGPANWGLRASATANTAGDNVGIFASSQGSSVRNLGVYGRTTVATGGAVLNVGVSGYALSASTANVGGYFALQSSTPIITNSAALIADNGSQAQSIMLWRDNQIIMGGIADGGVIHGDGAGLTNLHYIADLEGNGTNTTLWANVTGSTNRIAFSVTNGIKTGDFAGATNYNISASQGVRVGGDFKNSTNLIIAGSGGITVIGDFSESTNVTTTGFFGSMIAAWLEGASSARASASAGSWVGVAAPGIEGMNINSGLASFTGLTAQNGNNIVLTNSASLMTIDAYLGESRTNVNITGHHSVIVGGPPSNFTNIFSFMMGVIGTNGAVTGFDTNGFFGDSASLTNGVLWQSGSQLTNIYTATATLDFGNVATIGCADLTMAVTGAALGDVVDLGVPNASVVANSSYSAWVSAADTVTVRFCALISGDPASGVFRAEVHKWK